VAKRIGLAEAKAKFSDVVEQVLHGSEHFIVERRGRAVAAIVTVEDLRRLEASGPTGVRPAGALALVGAWEDVADADIDAMVADVYAERERDTGRPVRLKA
jgi:prevent-host-death family protein